MAKITIVKPYPGDDVFIMNTGVVPNFPITNLQVMQPGVVARAPDTNVDWTWDMGTGNLFRYNFAALLFTNCSPFANYRVQVSASTAFTAPTYDSGWLPVYKHQNFNNYSKVHIVHKLPQFYTIRYARISIDDPANEFGFIEAGRGFFGTSWTPTYNMPFGWNIQWNDLSETERARSGAMFVTKRNSYKVLNFTLDYLSEEEMYDNAFALDREYGENNGILVIPDIDNNARLMDQMVYGLSTQLTPVTNRIFNVFQKRYRIEELI